MVHPTYRERPNAINERTKLVEAHLRDRFSSAEAYQFNSASIRVRVIDECFGDKSKEEREDAVLPLIEELPENVREDITMIVLLTESEAENSSLNREFLDPSKSAL